MHSFAIDFGNKETAVVAPVCDGTVHFVQCSDWNSLKGRPLPSFLEFKTSTNVVTTPVADAPVESKSQLTE